MTKQIERIKMLEKHLKIIKTILDANCEWNNRQREIAKWTFASTMMYTTDEITYQITLMSGRDIVEELENTIQLLNNE